VLCVVLLLLNDWTFSFPHVEFQSVMEIRLMKRTVLILFIVICCVVSQSPVSSARLNGNPYKILGINRSASSQEIRKAYKQLVVIWHPDKNQEEGSKEKFLQITAAYEVC